MLQTYLKMAFRILKRNKGFSFINVFGLALGIACCILIFLWVQDEMSYDKFHNNIDQLHRVVQYQYRSDGSIDPWAVTSAPTGQFFKDNFPEVIDFARFDTAGSLLVEYGEKKYYEDTVVFADPAFFKLFTFPILKGNRQNPLQNLHDIVITERIAQKYFGDEDPIGKVITINNKIESRVNAVIKNVPSNSHLQFDFVLYFERLIKELGMPDTWGNENYFTYVQVENNTNVNILNDKARPIMKKIWPSTKTELQLQPVSDIHLRSNFLIDVKGQSNIRSPYILFFSTIALFVLIIACVNFMNLSTARAASRAREIGIRKVSGATRRQIARQFYLEAVLFSFISMIIALIIVWATIPAFNNVTGKDISFSLFSNYILMSGILGITVITSILSGVYPAQLLSRMKPIVVLKGSKGSLSGGSLFRRILVVTQFTLSLMLIIGTATVYNQLGFMQNKKLGYDKDHMIYFRNRGLGDKTKSFKEELLKHPGVLSATSASDVPTYTIHSTSGFKWEGKTDLDKFHIYHFSGDYDYLETMGIEVVKGRGFSEEFSQDSLTESFLLNEEAIKLMNIQSPIGKSFTLWNKKGKIVGVVKDFHFKSLHQQIEPLVIRIDTRMDRQIIARISSHDIGATIDHITATYKNFVPQYPLEYKFLDSELGKLYEIEERTQKVFIAFAILAILIACIGLFGLTAHLAEKRTKEVGIRKVLGASTSRIINLLSRETIILVLLGNIIAWPAAYYAMNKWLEGFAYRSSLNIRQFIFAGLVTLVIALATVSYQTIKTARSNPVNSLKYE